MEIKDIDFNKEPELIVPISDLPNAINVKRYYRLKLQSSVLNSSNNTILIDGTVLHRIEYDLELPDGTTVKSEKPAPGIPDLNKKFIASNNDKVDINGHLDTNGQYGQYNYIYWMTFYKFISPQEAIMAAVIEADLLKKFDK